MKENIDMKYKSLRYVVLSIMLAFMTNELYAQDAVQLSTTQKYMISSLPSHLVIAHRGTTFWAPEETEAAMRWARNIGADYVEFDLQRTKDGYLIALHDQNLLRTTDVVKKFPLRQQEGVASFTYEELLTLDAGTWFNIANPTRAKKTFEGLDILTLEDVVQIAEGKRIVRDVNGKRVLFKDAAGVLYSQYENDPADNGHRPGIYVETKVPSFFPGIESDLKTALIRLGWYTIDASPLKQILTQPGKVAHANSLNRVILQTFSKESLTNLQGVFTKPLPTCYLLWRGSDLDDIPNDSLSAFQAWVNFGILHGATIIGPSIAGAPNHYPELLSKARVKILQQSGLMIHAYSFDTALQMKKYHRYVHGMFSNKAEEALKFYGKPSLDAAQVLRDLGY
jgi:glycerophosphoryl diester phosphodiesterase